jgi:phosphatase NudJ
MGAPKQTAHFVVLVVVEHQGKYLVVHETKHGQLWYLPAGGIEEGESPADGGRRETMEEAGIAIEPRFYLDVEHYVRPGPVVVLRFIMVARATSFEPKRTADEHSLEARWLTRAEIALLPLRDPEVLRHIDAYERLRASKL